MRKVFYIYILMFTFVFFLTDFGTAQAESVPRVILYTDYIQIENDDRAEIGFIDEKGVIRTLTGSFSELEWPYKTEDQLEYLSHTEKFREEGTLSSAELFSLKSLLSVVERQEYDPVFTGILDIGTEESYAVRYSREGEPESILLGSSCGSMFENKDPNAQALYLLLRRLFPAVYSCYPEPGAGPEGYQPVPLADFIEIDAEAVVNAEIGAFSTDCEEGNIPVELTEEEKTELRTMIRDGVVTGKADNVFSTGGVSVYSFYDQDGKLLGTVSLEGGLLVMNDGRYYFIVR